MAGKIGKKNVSVTDRLVREPYQFTFYQAVRLLMAGAGARDTDTSRRDGAIGTSSTIDSEPVRFKTRAGLNFAPSEIVSLVDSQNEAESDSPPPPMEMQVAFWGLTGPAGALPNHYTQQVIDRVHVKDHAMHDFFDLFSHRTLSFFYRAWEKYFLAAGFEASSRSEDAKNDLIREALLSLVGRGTDSVRDRLEATDDALIYYGGLFVERPTAESLRAMIADFLGLPSKVLSLFGQWLVLPNPERSRMGVMDGHCQLGVDTIVGERTWDPSSKFRVQLGPVTWKQFENLMPTGNSLVRTCQLIRSYVGLELEFDLQVLLRAEEIPMCRFASPGSDGGSPGISTPSPYLGWNTWLCSEQPKTDSDDAVFYHDGSPSR